MTIDWPTALIAIWLAGAAVALVRLVVALARVARITGRAHDVTDPQWMTSVDAAAATLGLAAPVALKISEDSAIPVACGIRNATVLLPPDAAGWPEERQRVVLLHELAHVARRDCLVQAIAQLVRVHSFWKGRTSFARRGWISCTPGR